MINANGLWVAAGNSGTGLYYSTDGMTWEQGNITGGSFSVLAYENGLWVTGSMAAGFWYSSDGKTWTQSNFTSSESIIGQLKYGGGVWIVTSASHSSSWGTYYSTDGKTWTQSNATPGTCDFLEYQKGIWVLRSSGIFYSTDGKTWESLDINTYAPSYVNGLWICSSGSYICYSKDGKTWTQTGCPCLAMGQTSCANGVWLRTGYTIMPKDATGIGVFYSTDGKN